MKCYHTETFPKIITSNSNHREIDFWKWVGTTVKHLYFNQYTWKERLYWDCVICICTSTLCTFHPLLEDIFSISSSFDHKKKDFCLFILQRTHTHTHNTQPLHKHIQYTYLYYRSWKFSSIVFHFWHSWKIL